MAFWATLSYYFIIIFISSNFVVVKTNASYIRVNSSFFPGKMYIPEENAILRFYI